MRPIGDAFRWHALNSLRVACSFGDKGSLFVSAMIFHASCKAKLKFIAPSTISLCSYESSVKRGVLGCRRPGLSISISRHKVVLRQVHALHEKRPISLRGASYAMDLCNESVRRKPGRCDLWYQRMRQTRRGCKPWGQAERRILRNVTFEMNPWNATEEMHSCGYVFRPFGLLCGRRAPAIRRYSYIRIAR